MSALRAMSTSEVELLERLKSRSSVPYSNTIKWPSDEELELLAKAVKNGASKITLNDREFIIRPKNRFGEVFVKPVTGFTPCGVFEVERLLREHG